MIRTCAHLRRRLFAVGGLMASTLLLASPALAHEGREHGDLEMVVGFGTEPAFAGQPNSVQLILHHDGEPVVDLGDSLSVEVMFGEESMDLPLEPHFRVGVYGEPGDYRAWFIPTRPGAYTFHFYGTIEDEEIDETFTSGPDTFSDVGNPAELSFPAQDPTTGELAERIDREIPRLSEEIEGVRADAAAGAEAAAQAQAAADDAARAGTLGIVGIVVGTLGVLLGARALVTARKRA
jgi:hypothetical protein